jgi:hypothetical protein
MLSTNEALGAALLMLILQYMQSSDSNEKQGLLDVISSLVGSQQQQGSSSMLSYSSSQVSIESTQMVMINTSDAINSYAGATATAQQAPQVDSGSAGLDVTA